MGAEYDAICCLLRNRGMSAGLEVHRIERLQNMRMATRYNYYSQIGQGNELLLFHGTRQANIDAIVEEGTDFRLHGANATKYGNGSYFAVYSSYSANFCDEAADNVLSKMVRYMFLCAVKCGEFCKGRNGLRRPPKRADNKGMFDSCVDDMDNPTMYVTFDNAQSLPLYLITFSFDNSS